MRTSEIIAKKISASSITKLMCDVHQTIKAAIYRIVLLIVLWNFAVPGTSEENNREFYLPPQSAMLVVFEKVILKLNETLI